MSAADYEATVEDGLFTKGRPWSHLSVTFHIQNGKLYMDGWEIVE